MMRKLKEFVYGKLLGDGSLENRGTAHSRLQIRHSIRQKEYVDWCYDQLKKFVPSLPKRHKNSYYFRTRSLPIFTNQRVLWYRNNRKSIPKNLKLTPYILAIWYMDDGYYDQVRKSIWLCTHCFQKQELYLLQRLLNKMGIDSSMIKDRTHFKLRVLSKHTGKFITIIKPYILPSFNYKIGIAP